MLTRAHRLSARRLFAPTIRRGLRVGSATLVLHLDPDPHDRLDAPARVGFVVSRAVGSAVTRNRVRRRLRHLVADRLDRLPRGSVLVVRALAPAAQASYPALAADLDTALARVLARAAGRSAGGARR